MRRFAAMVVALPIMVAGGLCAHWLAYLLAVPDGGTRQALLAATGHAYEVWVPVVIGAFGAVSLILLSAVVLRRGALVSRLRLPPALFVTLPAVGFVLQELAERAAVGYGTPWHVCAEPTFWRGLLLQVPFGLLAFLIASVLLRVAEAVEGVVARRRRRCRRPVRTSVVLRMWSPIAVTVPRRARAGDALRFRGPPAAAFGRR